MPAISGWAARGPGGVRERPPFAYSTSSLCCSATAWSISTFRTFIGSSDEHAQHNSFRAAENLAVDIVLIGLNHRTAPVELRERVSFTSEDARLASEELRSRGVLSETLVLSTCNRSELYGVPAESAPQSAQDSAGAIELFLATFHKIEPAALSGSLYRRHDREAVRHLFRVAAGLDSMMLGEAEILGQVREAYRIAVDHGGTGPVLNRMFQGALEVGKRVRSETEISTRPMSVAFAGVKLAERIFRSLRSHK